MYIVTTIDKHNVMTKSPRLHANELPEYVSSIKMENMTSYTVEEVKDFPALKAMYSKLDNVKLGQRGYIAYLPEVKEILGELSSCVPANVWFTSHEAGVDGIEIKIGFHLDRSEL